VVNAMRDDVASFATIRGRLRDVPAGVWALGFVSMLMDIS
jgi:hypothetical protein